MKLIETFALHLFLTVLMVAVGMFAGNLRTWENAVLMGLLIYSASGAFGGIMGVAILKLLPYPSATNLVCAWMLISTLGVVVYISLLRRLAGYFFLSTTTPEVIFGFILSASLLIASAAVGYVLSTKGETKKA